MSAYLFVMITVLLWGGAAIVDKKALNLGDPFIGVTIRSLTVTTACLIMIIFTGRTKALTSVGLNPGLFFALSGIMAGFLAMFTYYSALKLEPASKIVPLASTYPLIAAILGFIILKEKVSLERVVGVVLIVSGIYLVQMRK